MSKSARPSDRIFEALTYDPETGAITKRDGTSAIVKGHRYPRVWFEGRMLYAHRVAWLLAGNGWPECPIDHANGDLDDRRLFNLRVATIAQNTWNAANYGKYAKGVSFDRRVGKFQSAITTHGKRKYLGYFLTEAEAAAAYIAAANALHGEFARASS